MTTTGAKMRVYEIAREVGIPNKDLLAKIRAMGLEVNNHMSSIDADDVVKIKRTLEKEHRGGAAPSGGESKAAAAGAGAGAVVRRRSGAKADEPVAAAPAAPQVVPPMVRRRAVEDSAPVAETKAAPAAAPVVAEPARRRPEPVVADEPVESAAEPAEHEQASDFSPEVPAVQTRPARSEQEPSSVSTTAEAPTAPHVADSRPPFPVETSDAPGSAAESDAAPPMPAMPPPGADKPRSRVIIAGPRVVARGASGGDAGAGTASAAPNPSAQADLSPAARAGAAGAPQSQPGRAGSVFVRPRDPVREAARDAARDAANAASREVQPAGPKTVPEVVADTARSRFEQELDRARARMAEREAERAPERPLGQGPMQTVEIVNDPRQPREREPRDSNRPAVGTIIALPARIKITERSPARGVVAPPPPGAGQIRGRFAQQQQTRPGGGGGGGGKPGMRNNYGNKKMPMQKGKGKATLLTTPAEHKRVIRIEDTIALADLSRGMGVKAPEVLKKLWGMGMTGVNINASIDVETAQLLAAEFGYEVQNVAFKEESIFSEVADDAEKMVSRSPVVTVMGHVDHGKTSLLDQIRKTRVAAGESGGITQHIAAYKVPGGEGHGDVVFLDTPGHEAFTEMRARGANVTDIVILVVAANDGVMPQTVEALNHAKAAKVPIIVAVNKIDLPDAQPERVQQQLADYGLIPEQWGGDTQYVNVSALRGEGIDKLLETIALVSEMGELKANPDRPAQGTVIEARLDRARGPMATVLIQEGTLRPGDIIVAGRTVGRVRAMLDHRGETVKEAGPSTPVEVLGLDGVPEAGDLVNVAEDERVAKEVVEHRRQMHRKKQLASTVKVSLENLMVRMSDDADKELKIVLKADVQGSAEALKAALIKQSTEKVKVVVIGTGVGGITESDVNLAKAGGAIVLGFHVRPAGKSAKLAEQEGVEIRLYDIIYDALDEVKAAMAGLLAPIKREIPMGKLEVRDTFTIPKIGTIAGCMVTSGKVTRKALLRVIRDSVQIYEGRVGSLRRFKDDVSEVENGYECGVMVAGYNDLKAGDIIESYEVVEEAAKL